MYEYNSVFQERTIMCGNVFEAQYIYDYLKWDVKFQILDNMCDIIHHILLCQTYKNHYWGRILKHIVNWKLTDIESEFFIYEMYLHLTTLCKQMYSNYNIVAW